MSSTRTIWFTALASIMVGGCVGGFGNGGRFGEPDDPFGEVPTPACPVDPDCAIDADPTACDECADYWICEDKPEGGKRCTNPGPDYPDGGQWDCEDVDGSTICRRQGDFPDGGGGGAWSCEMQAEWVVCTDDTPNYPDEGGGGPFNCWFDEFRICETFPGDGGGWACYDPGDGSTECRNNNPDYPDDGTWSCWDDGGRTYCRRAGTTVPDGGGGGVWNCEIQGEFVVCSTDRPDYPDGGSGGDWDCRFGDEFRICTPTIPEIPDDGGHECVAGVQRWCDDAVYCSWGKQTCLPDGTWGACVEPRVTETGLHDRPDTACGCRFFYFNDECCEDQEDRNGDGNPDCLIPSGHTAPACTSDGGLCSYCDSHTDCGGPSDMCVFRRDGYAMCGRDCTTGSCPSGYECQTLATRTGSLHQCVPTTASCD